MNFEQNYYNRLNDLKKAKNNYLREAIIKENKEMLAKIGGPFIDEDIYKREILPYWEKFNYKPEKMWFDIYCNRDKKINKYMVPADLYFNELIPYLNNLDYWKALADKNYIDILFADINRPLTICKNMNGFYYDSNNKLISEDNALDLLYNYNKKMVIKPTVDTHAGHNVMTIDNGFKNKNEIKKIFAKYDKNFICQERINQHKDLAALNPDCVQAIRVMSVLYKNEVHNVLNVLRIGDVDTRYLKTVKGNVTQGIAVEILENGAFYKKGVNKYGQWVENDFYGKKLSSYKFPSIKKIYEITKKIHLRIPHFRCVGWDFSVDVKGNPILIEFNVSPGVFIQFMTGRPVFGKLTPKILAEYFR